MSFLDSHPWIFGLIARSLMDMAAKTVQPYLFLAKCSCSEISCGKTLPIIAWPINLESTLVLSALCFGVVLYTFTYTRTKVFVFGVGNYCILLINCICPLEIQKKLSLRFDITDALKDVVYEEIFSREDALIKKLASFIEDPLKEKTNRQRKPVVCKKILNIVIIYKVKAKFVFYLL